MLFPFRTSAIFRNRWIALLWAAGICFMASEIVDSVAGVTTKDAKPAVASTPPGDDPVAAALGSPPPGPPPPPMDVAN